MGFNKLFLPDPIKLQERIDQDEEATARWISKADMLIGSDASMLMAHALLEKIENKLNKTREASA